jgi:hypothetical protein
VHSFTCPQRSLSALVNSTIDGLPRHVPRKRALLQQQLVDVGVAVSARNGVKDLLELLHPSANELRHILKQ